jgi:hypothetical protein
MNDRVVLVDRADPGMGDTSLAADIEALSTLRRVVLVESIGGYRRA